MSMGVWSSLKKKLHFFEKFLSKFSRILMGGAQLFLHILLEFFNIFLLNSNVTFRNVILNG